MLSEFKNTILKKEIYLNKLWKILIKYRSQKTFLIKKIKDSQINHNNLLFNQHHLQFHFEIIKYFFNNLILLINLQFILNKPKEHIILNKKFIKNKFRSKEINH